MSEPRSSGARASEPRPATGASRSRAASGGDAARVTRLLPLACLIAAAVLFASELMTMFEFTPPGAEPLDLQSAGERHGNAIFVVSLFAIGALAVAVITGSKPAAIAVGAMGGIALLFFLLVDLPDAGQVGTLDDPRGSFFDAEAVPQEGFWLMMVSALGLAVSGAALATLSPEQLLALRPRRRRADRPSRERPGGALKREASGNPVPHKRATAHGADRERR